MVSTSPVSHRRGAAFAISRLLTSPTTTPVVNPILLPGIHTPFSVSHVESLPASSDPSKTASQSLALLTTLLLNTDPSPMLISTLLNPILVPLYSLLEFLSDHRGAVYTDPGTKEMVEGLLRTWARVAVTSDATAGWWGVIQGTGGWGLMDLRNESSFYKEWALRNGELVVEQRSVVRSFLFTFSDLCLCVSRRQSENIPSLTSLLNPQAVSGNPLQMHPDPVQLVKFLKSVDRKEVSGALLVRCLNEYSALREAGDAVNPLRRALIPRLPFLKSSTDVI